MILSTNLCNLFVRRTESTHNSHNVLDEEDGDIRFNLEGGIRNDVTQFVHDAVFDWSIGERRRVDREYELRKRS